MLEPHDGLAASQSCTARPKSTSGAKASGKAIDISGWGERINIVWVALSEAVIERWWRKTARARRLVLLGLRSNVGLL